jgi:hypothetical protein
MAANNHKNSQRSSIDAAVTNTLYRTPFYEILSGDHSFIRKSFFYMFEKGWFPYLGSRHSSEIKHWVKDLSQIVSLVILEKAISGGLDKIRHPKTYIKHIIRNKSIDENNRLSKSIFIDSIQMEDDNEKS